MSLFGIDYSKPGRGVSPEEANRRSYFSIFFRKFWKISQTSIVYSLCNIIFLTALVFFALPILLCSDDTQAQQIASNIAQMLNGKQLLPIGFFIPFMFMGPGTVGLTHITYKFSRQQHAFVWSDFWEYTKKYFLKGLLASSILTLLFYLYLNALVFYIHSEINQLIITIFAVNIGLILVMGSFYVYPLILASDIKLREIFRCAFIMALANSAKTLLVIFVLVVVHGFILLYAYPVWLFLMPLLLFGWSSYTINYVIWDVIDDCVQKNRI